MDNLEIILFCQISYLLCQAAFQQFAQRDDFLAALALGKPGRRFAQVFLHNFGFAAYAHHINLRAFFAHWLPPWFGLCGGVGVK